jgi:hypothetical protein
MGYLSNPGRRTALGQTTVNVNVPSNGTSAPQAGRPGLDLATVAVVSGAILLVTEMLGVTHVSKWVVKTLKLGGKRRKK